MSDPNAPASRRFGDDPAQYDKARPAHPAWIFDEILDRLGPCRVLDVGCGTGVAGLELRKRGCDVLGVEPDERMAAVAVERGLPVDIAPFEAWDPSGRTFDLICSAQAWHWIDDDIGLETVTRALRPGGRFAAFWYGHRHEPDVAAALRSARGLPPTPTAQPPDPGRDTQAALSRFDDSFTEPEVRRRTTSATYSADEWLEVESSFGTNRALRADVRDRLFAAIRGVIEPIQPITVHIDNTLVTAIRRS